MPDKDETPERARGPGRPRPKDLDLPPEVADPLALLESDAYGLRRLGYEELVNLGERARPALLWARDDPRLRALADRALAEIAAGRTYAGAGGGAAARAYVAPASDPERLKLIPPLVRALFDTNEDGQIADDEFARAQALFGDPARPRRLDPADVVRALAPHVREPSPGRPPSIDWEAFARARGATPTPEEKACLERQVLGDRSLRPEPEEPPADAREPELFETFVRENHEPLEVRRRAAARLAATKRGAGRLLAWFRERVKLADWTVAGAEAALRLDRPPREGDLPKPTERDVARPVFLLGIEGLGNAADREVAGEVVRAFHDLVGDKGEGMPPDVLLAVTGALVSLAVRHDQALTGPVLDGWALGTFATGDDLFAVPRKTQIATIFSLTLANKEFAARILLRALDAADATAARAAARALNQFTNEATYEVLVDGVVGLLAAAAPPTKPVRADPECRLPLFRLLGRLHLDRLKVWETPGFRTRLADALADEVVARPDGEAAAIAIEVLFALAQALAKDLERRAADLGPAVGKVYRRAARDLDGARLRGDEAAFRLRPVEVAGAALYLLGFLPAKEPVEVLAEAYEAKREWAARALTDIAREALLSLADRARDASTRDALRARAEAWTKKPPDPPWAGSNHTHVGLAYWILERLPRREDEPGRKALDFLARTLDEARTREPLNLAAAAVFGVGTARAHILLVDEFVEGRNPALLAELDWFLGFLYADPRRKEMEQAVPIVPEARKHAEETEARLRPGTDLAKHLRARRIVQAFAGHPDDPDYQTFSRRATELLEASEAIARLRARYAAEGLLPFIRAHDAELARVLEATYPGLVERFWEAHARFWAAMPVRDAGGAEIRAKDPDRVKRALDEQARLLGALKGVRAGLPPVEKLWADWRAAARVRLARAVATFRAPLDKELREARAKGGVLAPVTDLVPGYERLLVDLAVATDFERNELAVQLASAIRELNHDRLDRCFDVEVAPLIEAGRLTEGIRRFRTWFAPHRVRADLEKEKAVAVDRFCRLGAGWVSAFLEYDADRVIGGIAEHLRRTTTSLLKRLDASATSELFPKIDPKTDKYRTPGQYELFGETIYWHEDSGDPGLDSVRWPRTEGGERVLKVEQTAFPTAVRHLWATVESGRNVSILDGLDDPLFRTVFKRAYRFSHAARDESSDGTLAEYTLRTFAELAEMPHAETPVAVVEEGRAEEEAILVRATRDGYLLRKKPWGPERWVEPDRLRSIVVTGPAALADDYRRRLLRLAHFYRNKDYQKPRPYTFLRQYGLAEHTFIEAFELANKDGEPLTPDRIKARLKEGLRRRGLDRTWADDVGTTARTGYYFFRCLFAWDDGSADAQAARASFTAGVVDLLSTPVEQRVADEERRLYDEREKHFLSGPFAADWKAWNSAFDPKGEILTFSDATCETLASGAFWKETLVELAIDLVVMLVLFLISAGIGTAAYGALVSARWAVRTALWARRASRLARIARAALRYAPRVARFLAEVNVFTLGMKGYAFAKAELKGEKGEGYDSFSEYLADAGKTAVVLGMLKAVDALYLKAFRLHGKHIAARHHAGLWFAEFAAMDIYALAIEPTLGDITKALGWTKKGGRWWNDVPELDTIHLFLGNAFFTGAFRAAHLCGPRLTRALGSLFKKPGFEDLRRKVDAIDARLEAKEAEAQRVVAERKEALAGEHRSFLEALDAYEKKAYEVARTRNEVYLADREAAHLRSKAGEAATAEAGGEKPAEPSKTLAERAAAKEAEVREKRAVLSGAERELVDLDSRRAERRAAVEEKQRALVEAVEAIADEVGRMVKEKADRLSEALAKDASAFSPIQRGYVRDLLGAAETHAADIQGLKDVARLVLEVGFRQNPEGGFDYRYSPENAKKVADFFNVRECSIAREAGTHGEHVVATPWDPPVPGGGQVVVSPRPAERPWIRAADEALVPREEPTIVVELGAGEGGYSAHLRQAARAQLGREVEYVATDFATDPRFLHLADKRGIETRRGVDANNLAPHFPRGRVVLVRAVNPYGYGLTVPGVVGPAPVGRGRPPRRLDPRMLESVREVLPESGECSVYSRSNVLREYVETSPRVGSAQREALLGGLPKVSGTNGFTAVVHGQLAEIARGGWDITVEPASPPEGVVFSRVDTHPGAAVGPYNVRITLRKTEAGKGKVTFRVGDAAFVEPAGGP